MEKQISDALLLLDWYWSIDLAGSNKGRVFWLCNRPVGEGYERSGTKKIDVNPDFRCNYFKCVYGRF